jgi:hypothetical protein
MQNDVVGRREEEEDSNAEAYNKSSLLLESRFRTIVEVET